MKGKFRRRQGDRCRERCRGNKERGEADSETVKKSINERENGYRRGKCDRINEGTGRGMGECAGKINRVCKISR